MSIRLALCLAALAVVGVQPAFGQKKVSPDVARRDPVASLVPGSGTGARDNLADGSPCQFCPELAVVPAGSFIMGSPSSEIRYRGYDGREEPLHKVTIPHALAVGRFAITRREFAAFVSETSHKIDGCQVWNGSRWEQQSNKSWQSPGYVQDDRHPVVCVNWDDANAFAGWLSGKTGKSYRLLSEAEREYVTRAGTNTPFWWGSTISTGQANYDGSGYAGERGGGENLLRTVPVDTFKPNPWGLYQVHGNVWEWCGDAWRRSYEGAPTDGSSWQDGDRSLRMVRGGSWYFTPDYLRSAMRVAYHSGLRNGSVGFRLARTLGTSR